MKEEPQYLVMKIYRSSYSFEKGQISLVYERDRWMEGDKDRLLY